MLTLSVHRLAKSVIHCSFPRIALVRTVLALLQYPYEIIYLLFAQFLLSSSSSVHTSHTRWSRRNASIARSGQTETEASCHFSVKKTFIHSGRQGKHGQSSRPSGQSAGHWSKKAAPDNTGILTRSPRRRSMVCISISSREKREVSISDYRNSLIIC